MPFVEMKEPTREIIPRSVPVLLREAFRSSSRNSRADLRPDLDIARAVWERPIDHDNVRQFETLTGHKTQSGALPPGYIFRLAFRNLAAIVVDEKFPLRAMGTLHRENTLTVTKPVMPDPNTTVRASTWLSGFEQKDNMLDMRFDTAFSANGEPFARMESIITSLNRLKPKDSKPQEPPILSGGWKKVADVKLPGTLGWSYARISDDWNSHHIPGGNIAMGVITLVTNPARAGREFGRPMILQGNCTASMAIAALPFQPVQRDGTGTLRTSYLAPVALPGTQEIWAAGGRDRIDFAVRDPRQSGRVMVMGTLEGPK